MKIFLLALFFVSSAAQGANVGEYRGHVEIQNRISERILLNNPFFLGTYADGQTGLLSLLGEHSSNGENSFRNGRPNSINMLIWQLVLNGFVMDVQAGCAGNSKLLFSPSFQQVLRTMCEWPSSSAQSESSMRLLWLSLMSYDAPEEEFLAWRAFFLHSSFAGRPSSEALPALLLAIVYNPHFLLRK